MKKLNQIYTLPNHVYEELQALISTARKTELSSLKHLASWKYPISPPSLSFLCICTMNLEYMVFYYLCLCPCQIKNNTTKDTRSFFFLAWRLISSGYLVITISSCQTKCSTTHKHKQITFFLSFPRLICPFKHLGHSSPPPVFRPEQESVTFSWTHGTKLKDVIQ